jgi:L-seryl-tRNA(Ser) seleniumtransferase
MRHPLARALRPGGLVLAALQETALAYLDKRAATDVPFWAMVATPVADLRRRADAIVDVVAEHHPTIEAIAMEALPGAGSAPGVTMPSFGIEVAGDHLAALRDHETPVIARSRDDRTLLDLRSVAVDDDGIIIDALRVAASS